jgi:hypothetical protein
VAVSQTIHRIEQVLIKCGVSGIMKEYVGTSGEIAAHTFQIEMPNGKMTIRMPADVKKAHEALWANYVDGDKLTADGTMCAWPYQALQESNFKGLLPERAES